MICPACTKEAVCEFHRTERSCLTDHHDEEVERLETRIRELEGLLADHSRPWPCFTDGHEEALERLENEKRELREALESLADGSWDVGTRHLSEDSDFWWALSRARSVLERIK